MSKKHTNEYDMLLQQVRSADLSANNPEFQAVIEHKIAHWVESYQIKKRMSMHDCYGGPGEIPNEIPVNGGTYSPPQILEHVRARDEVVMQCACSQHNQTQRELLQGIIHPNPDSIFLTVGMADAIIRWYGGPTRDQRLLDLSKSLGISDDDEIDVF